MAKKKTAETPAPGTASPRKRAPVKRTAEPVQPPSVANDRDTMPEPAGQRVTAADATEADSVTFVAPPDYTTNVVPGDNTTNVVAEDNTTNFSPAGNETNVAPADSRPTYDEIAEAAYHRYLNRGASDGQDFEDWIAAEQDLKAR